MCRVDGAAAVAACPKTRWRTTKAPAGETRGRVAQSKVRLWLIRETSCTVSQCSGSSRARQCAAGWQLSSWCGNQLPSGIRRFKSHPDEAARVPLQMPSVSAKALRSRNRPDHCGACRRAAAAGGCRATRRRNGRRCRRGLLRPAAAQQTYCVSVPAENVHSNMAHNPRFNTTCKAPENTPEYTRNEGVATGLRQLRPD